MPLLLPVRLTAVLTQPSRLNRFGPTSRPRRRTADSRGHTSFTFPLAATPIEPCALLYSCLLDSYRHHGCPLRGSPSLRHHHRSTFSDHFLSPFVFDVVSTDQCVTQSFTVGGAGLWAIRRWDNEGKMPRWNKDKWDRVSEPATYPMRPGSDVLTLLQQSML